MAFLCSLLSHELELLEAATANNRKTKQRKLHGRALVSGNPIINLSIVPCSAVKATGVIRQYEAPTLSRTVPVGDAAFVKQAAGAKLSSLAF